MSLYLILDDVPAMQWSLLRLWGLVMQLLSTC